MRWAPVLLAGGLVLATLASGAEPPVEPSGESPAPRPRVGLVLAGGGARGAAHVGVLKVLEEMRIPVDCVAGTSMGALVGALYSTGYSPAEIEDLLVGLNWDLMFRDAPERRQMSFRRKEDDSLALFPIEIGVGPRGMSAPSGFIAGQKLDNLFRTLTLESSNVSSFDELRLPYRAVAADLLTGDAVILDHGDLARAMRASMSIPGVFPPVEIDGRTLIDGGIALNLPVQVVQDLGVDRIVAIDVGTPPKRQVEYLSAAGVYGQTFAVISKKNVAESIKLLKSQDLLITPGLEGIGAGSFDKCRQAIAVGEEAARRAAPELSSFSVSEEEYAAFLKRQRRPASSAGPNVRIDEVVIEGAQRTDPESLRRRITTRPGQPLVTGQLYSDLRRVYQAGEFESVGYRIDRRDGANILVIQAKEKWWGPGFLRFGVGLDSDWQGVTEYRLIADYRRTGINRLGAEWKSVASIGNPLVLATEFYQPLDRAGVLFAAPRLLLSRERSDFYLDDGSREVQRTHRFGGGFDVGVQLGNYGEIRLGLFADRVHVDAVTASALPAISRGEGGARLKITFDRLDNVFFPTKGNYTNLELTSSMNSLGADEDVDLLSFKTFQAVSVGRNTFLGGVQVGTDFGSQAPFYEQFRLGGMMNLSGLPRGRLRGNVKGLLTLGDYWQALRLGAFGKLYAGVVAEAGNVWAHSSDASFGDLIYSGTIFVGLDTKLAPVYVAYGVAEGGERTAYLVIGKPLSP